MRILICGDVHFCEYSSIIRSNGDKFSTRLENCIQSVNWVEDQAFKYGCDEVWYAGDFLDKPDLNSREITALCDIKWATVPHTFLIGNHEASNRALTFNSTSALRKFGFELIDSPTYKAIENYDILFLPYITDPVNTSLAAYWENFNIQPSARRKKLILSHNDIKGIRYGVIESKEGISLDDIQNNCNLFLNGHVHNGSWICKNGINIGNLTGQNFSEDASFYDHHIIILDTFENTIDLVENPYAFNFYKFDISDINELEKVKEIKNYAVLSVKCKQFLYPEVLSVLDKLSSRIVEKRIITVRDSIPDSTDQEHEVLSGIDYMDKFSIFCKSKIGESSILNSELAEVCK